jgi:hypothetical protein
MKKLLIGILGLFCSQLLSQETPFGMEFRVNTYTEGSQRNPQIASLSNGNFVICWENYGQPGEAGGIFGQIFTSNGNRVGEEFRINASSEGAQYNPKMASLSDGRFLVCWVDAQEGGFGNNIYGQIFSQDGNRLGGELLFDTNTAGRQSDPEIAILSDGCFVVCWKSYSLNGSDFGVFGQLFSREGNKLGSEFRANTYTDKSLYKQKITSLSDGGFIICWGCLFCGDSSNFIYGQRFTRDGIKAGEEFRIGDNTEGIQDNPSVISIESGGFLAYWESWGGHDGSVCQVFGQLFSQDGNSLGQEFRVNTFMEGYQCNPLAAPLPNGGFIISWNNVMQDSSGVDLYGQVFSSFGNRVGEEFRINTYTEHDQFYQQLISLPNGGFTVCWTSDIQDGSSLGVFGQLFSSDGHRIGTEFQVNSYWEDMQYFPKIISLKNGVIVVCWMSYGQDGSEFGIYAKCFPPSPLNHPLRPFYLLEPSPDSLIKTISPTLRWQQPSNQVVCYPWELHYQVFIDDNPDFISPEIIEQDKDTTATLQNLQAGRSYFWKVLSRNIDGDSLWSSNTNVFFVRRDTTNGVEDEGSTCSAKFVLQQNYPNPFNLETIIRLDLQEPGFVIISIYDISGEMVRVMSKEFLTAGRHSLTWDGKNKDSDSVPSGIYICRMEAKSEKSKFIRSVKMMMVR